MQATTPTRSNPKALPLTFSRIFNSLCIFLICFATANIFHQLVLGAFSYLFGYETVLTFASVHSSPTDYHYWSTPRVWIIYGLPLMLCIAIVIGIFVRVFLRQEKRKDIVRLFAFWMMVSFMLVITTYMSVAPVGQFLHKDLYQDISVLGYWYGIDPSTLLVFTSLSLAINFAFGFICGNELLRFSHVGIWQDKPSGRFYLLKTYFLFPLILGIPGTLLFSYPDSPIFHMLMALHALIYIPAIWFRYRSDFTSEAEVAVSDFIGKPIYILPGILLALVLLVRIFLSK